MSSTVANIESTRRVAAELHAPGLLSALCMQHSCLAPLFAAAQVAALLKIFFKSWLWLRLSLRIARAFLGRLSCPRSKRYSPLVWVAVPERCRPIAGASYENDRASAAAPPAERREWDRSKESAGAISRRSACGFPLTTHAGPTAVKALTRRTADSRTPPDSARRLRLVSRAIPPDDQAHTLVGRRTGDSHQKDYAGFRLM